MKHFVAILGLLVMASLGVGVARFAFASHLPGQLHIYRADDPAKQDPGLPGTENHVNAWWGLVDNGAIGWWADPNNPSFKADVVTALGNWTTPIPQLLWQEKPTPDPSETGVVFKIDHCAFNSLSCAPVTNAHNYSPLNASYWWRAEVKIDPDHDYGSGARAAAITHELGHLYGLHERYIAWSGCNAGELTILDFFAVTTPNASGPGPGRMTATVQANVTQALFTSSRHWKGPV